MFAGCEGLKVEACLPDMGETDQCFPEISRELGILF